MIRSSQATTGQPRSRAGPLPLTATYFLSSYILQGFRMYGWTAAGTMRAVRRWWKNTAIRAPTGPLKTAYWMSTAEAKIRIRITISIWTRTLPLCTCATPIWKQCTVSFSTITSQPLCPTPGRMPPSPSNWRAITASLQAMNPAFSPGELRSTRLIEMLILRAI